MMKKTLNYLSIKAMETAFEASYDGLHILDKEGNTLYINDACTRIEGTSKEDVETMNIHQLVEAGVYSQSVTLQVLEKKESVTINQTTKNGNEVLSTGTPVFDENGEIEMVIVNSRDVTALNVLKNELSLKNLQLENLKLEYDVFNDIVSHSPAMKKILSMALTIAKVDSTVLITGESGVGKGVLARFIHNNSNRAEMPFVKVDCSSIPESLFESELFGYEKGAFTGANLSGKKGLLEMAEGGTVFLDEIGELPISMQAKLMRAIQDLEIMPVGGKRTKKIDVRFVSATNMNLLKAVKEKKFREDLYYRLNVIPITIPPLRERREDIHPLINQMVNRINKRYKLNKELTVDVYDKMIEYSWPGNVRQLENTVERILVSSRNDIITKKDLPGEILGKGTGSDDDFDFKTKEYKTMLADYDRKLIEAAVKHEGSIPKAARLLNIDVTTLRRKLNKYCK